MMSLKDQKDKLEQEYKDKMKEIDSLNTQLDVQLDTYVGTNAMLKQRRKATKMYQTAKRKKIKCMVNLLTGRAIKTDSKTAELINKGGAVNRSKRIRARKMQEINKKKRKVLKEATKIQKQIKKVQKKMDIEFRESMKESQFFRDYEEKDFHDVSRDVTWKNKVLKPIIAVFDEYVSEIDDNGEKPIVIDAVDFHKYTVDAGINISLPFLIQIMEQTAIFDIGTDSTSAKYKFKPLKKPKKPRKKPRKKPAKKSRKPAKKPAKKSRKPAKKSRKK